MRTAIVCFERCGSRFSVSIGTFADDRFRAGNLLHRRSYCDISERPLLGCSIDWHVPAMLNRDRSRAAPCNQLDYRIRQPALG